MRGDLSRKIEVSGHEVDDVDEVLRRAESAGPVLGHAQDPVDAFGYRAGDSANGSENSIPVTAQSAHEFTHRFEPT